MIAAVVGLRAEARALAPLGARLGWRIEVGGGGAAGAAAAVARAIAAGATALVSAGVAGGLDPALRPGDALFPERVVFPDGVEMRADPALLGRTTPHTILAADAIAATADDKRRLREATGADAIDLETAAVARAGLPFAVLRAICDPAERDLPPAALIALDAAGAIGAGQVLASVLARPGQIPALLRLASDAARARKSLALSAASLYWPGRDPSDR